MRPTHFPTAADDAEWVPLGGYRSPNLNAANHHAKLAPGAKKLQKRELFAPLQEPPQGIRGQGDKIGGSPNIGRTDNLADNFASDLAGALAGTWRRRSPVRGIRRCDSLRKYAGPAI